MISHVLTALCLAAATIVGVHAHAHTGAQTRAFLRRRLPSNNYSMSPAKSPDDDDYSPINPGMSPSPETGSLNGTGSLNSGGRELPDTTITLIVMAFVIVVFIGAGICQYYVFRCIYRSLCKGGGGDDKSEDESESPPYNDWKHETENPREAGNTYYKERDNEDKEERKKKTEEPKKKTEEPKEQEGEGEEGEEQEVEREEEAAKRRAKRKEEAAKRRAKQKEEEKQKAQAAQAAKQKEQEEEAKQKAKRKQQDEQRKLEEKHKKEAAKKAWKCGMADLEKHFPKNAQKLRGGSLKKLKMEDKEFDGDKGAMALAMVLPYCQLEKVVLSKSNKHDQEKISDRGALALAKCLPDCDKLKELRLWGHRITYEGAKHLINALPDSTLTKLVLTDNPIAKEKRQELIDAAKTNKNKERITIEMNRIGWSSTFKKKFSEDKNNAWDKATTDCLKEKLKTKFVNKMKNDKLKKAGILDLQGKKLGDDGVEYLVRVLPFCRPLTKIILSENEITDDGAKALARVLQKCEALKELKLDWNKIGEEGLKSLERKLRESTLTKLSLVGVLEKLPNTQKKKMKKEFRNYNKKGNMQNIDGEVIEFNGI